MLRFPLLQCGRICVHQSGRFVIVSNRGHESLTIFRVQQGYGSNKTKSLRGTLSQIGFFHTRGETPRHFQFDHSGQFLIVANQDSDTIAIFTFNLTSGEINYTGNAVSCSVYFYTEGRCFLFFHSLLPIVTLDIQQYHIPSPNFVCCCPMLDREYDEEDDKQANEKVGYVVKDAVHLPTIPSSVVFDSTMNSSLDLQNELESARKEIAELKKQLSSITAERRTSTTSST